MAPVKIEEGQETHIKGFIMNKLYIGGFFAKKGKKHHGKHTSVKNLPKDIHRNTEANFHG